MQRNVQIGLTVNGEADEASFAPYKTLLEVLREDLGLTGTKHGCELGECGACAVIIEGEPRISCLKLELECAGRAGRDHRGTGSEGRNCNRMRKRFDELGG